MEHCPWVRGRKGSLLNFITFCSWLASYYSRFQLSKKVLSLLTALATPFSALLDRNPDLSQHEPTSQKEEISNWMELYILQSLIQLSRHTHIV